MLKQLETLTDELTIATYKAQSLLSDFGMDCENAELDGIDAPEMDATDRKRLVSITTATREALKLLTELVSK